MPLWRIRPVAEPDDPRWLDHAIWSEVVVRADSAAQARRAAAASEDADEPRDGRSGFDADEPIESLGEKLALPPFLEPRRREIEAGLRPL